MNQKQRIREEVWNKLLIAGVSQRAHGYIPPFKGQEEAANLLTKLKVYKEARKIFVPPDQAQYQVRLNCLRDGKTLIMATPGLKDGFYQVDKSISNWEEAVKSHQVTKHGRKLYTTFEDIGRVDLMITGAVAVSKRGERIGKGTGFFDWEYKILKEIGAVDDSVPIIGVVHPLQIYDRLPFGSEDVSVNYIVTPEEIIEIETPAPRPKGIDWKQAANLISKMRPLRELVSRESLKVSQ